MANVGESVSNSDAAGPSLDLVGVDLNGATTVTANQVMMVAGGAGAKKCLSVGRGDAVGILVGGQIGERSINGGQPDG